MTSLLHSFEQKISYHFNDIELLDLALTHSSCESGEGDNQRLEFLGDAVLDLVIAEELYRNNPDFDEGRLDQLRADVVKGKVLAQYARKLDIDRFLKISEPQRRHRPELSAAMLEDALEALIGAIYLDGGLETARTFILETLSDAIRCALENDSKSNPKGSLQEWIQNRHDGAVPKYITVSEKGPHHARLYEAAVEFNGRELGRGQGSSKKSAEIAAAEQALLRLGC